jgi:hypothetical protein
MEEKKEKKRSSGIFKIFNSKSKRESKSNIQKNTETSENLETEEEEENIKKVFLLFKI